MRVWVAVRGRRIGVSGTRNDDGNSDGSGAGHSSSSCKTAEPLLSFLGKNVVQCKHVCVSAMIAIETKAAPSRVESVSLTRSPAAATTLQRQPRALLSLAPCLPRAPRSLRLTHMHTACDRPSYVPAISRGLSSLPLFLASTLVLTLPPWLSLHASVSLTPCSTRFQMQSNGQHRRPSVQHCRCLPSTAATCASLSRRCMHVTPGNMRV